MSVSEPIADVAEWGHWRAERRNAPYDRGRHPTLSPRLSMLLHERLDVNFTCRQVHAPNTPDLPGINPIVLGGCGRKTYVFNQINYRFICSRRTNAINLHCDPMTIFGL